MSYGAAERSPVDIDEFERRMRVPGSRPPNDPLAELARLVNVSESKPDALDEMFARPGAAQSQAPSARDAIDLDALRGPYAEGAHSAGQGAYDRDVHHDTEHYDPAHDMHGGAPAVDADWSVPQSFERPVPEAREPRSRKPLYAAAAVIAVGVLGIGSTFAFKGSRSASGDVVEVKAAPGPVKVAAQAGPDRTNGAVDSTLLDRNAPNQPVTRVVDRQERPVDLKEASRATPRVVSTTPSNSSQMASLAAAAAGENGGSVFAEPRKVKTVAVRPDGTVMSNTSVDAQSPTSSATASSQTANGAAAVSKGATPKAVARVAASTTPKAVEKPESTAPTRTASVRPEGTATPASPKPAAKPVRTARAAQPADDNAADGDATAATTRAGASGGGFSIQLAAPGSEAEAKSTASRLGQKYSDALGGARVTVQKASDKSVYRVRTAGMSREDAVAACEKIKASGGNCFVAKN